VVEVAAAGILSLLLSLSLSLSLSGGGECVGVCFGEWMCSFFEGLFFWCFTGEFLSGHTSFSITGVVRGV